MLHAQCQQQQQEQCKKTADAYQITPDKIESLIKDFKMHRCELDFDKGFIKAYIFVLLIIVVIITLSD